MLITACWFLLAGSTLQAQSFYDVIYRPPSVRYDVLQTPHFELIFQRGLDTLVYEAAVTLEDAYREVRAETGLDREFSMPVVLNNFSDVSNGFVIAAPFRQEITAAPIKGKVLNPRQSDWLHQVLPHEMTHAAQAEVKGGFGFGSLLSVMSPDLERALNLGIPSGMTEGLAVLQESSETEGTGRLNYSMTLMEYRAAAASGHPWKIGQLLDPPGFTEPFDRYYIGGGMLTQFLTDSVKADFFGRSIKFYNRVPFFGYGAALWYGTGEPPWRLSSAFERAAIETEFERLAKLGPLTPLNVLTDELGLECRRPKWIDNSHILAYCKGYRDTPGFYRIDTSKGTFDYKFRESITEDFVYTLDRRFGTIAFARYHPDGTVTVSSKSNLHVLDLASGNDDKIKGGERCYAPVRIDRDRIWALHDDGQFNEVVEISDTSAARVIFKEYGTIVRELAVGPDGQVIALANRSGEQSIYLFVDEVDGWSLWPLLAAKKGAIYDPVWSPDGKEIVFSSDPTGVANIYVFSFRDNQVRKLTNVKFGALEPGVSPDGSKVAFAHYEREQYQIATVDLDIDQLEVVDDFGQPRRKPRVFGPIDRETRDSLVALVKPYRPFPSILRPRTIAPFIRFKQQSASTLDEPLGFGLGLTVLGADPLQQWSYSASAFHQSSRLWGRATLKTGMNVLRPFIRLLDEPESTTIRVDDESVAHVPYEERSARLGVTFPLRISQNVHTTSLIIGANADYKLLRLIDSNSNPLSNFNRRVTVNPTALFAFQLQTNIRDLIPNSGLLVASTAEIDAFTSDMATPSRAWRTEGSWFLPFLKHQNQGVQLTGGILWQTAGSTINIDTYVPRGYDGDVYLGPGLFPKVGFQVVQPLKYLDRGLVLVPISIEALYAYGFAETMGDWPDLDQTYSSIGLGLGARLRLFHNLRLDARIAVARLIEEDSWQVVFR